MKRKGQAALEFLTTYGWAFLVILVMIGALAYFGVLKPTRLLPDRCSIGPEFECIDYQISDSDNSIKLRLKNNVAEPIKLNGIGVSSESATSLTCSSSPNVDFVWTSSEIKDLEFSGCNLDSLGFVVGEKGKIQFKIKYYSVRSGEGYAHNVDAEVFSTVV